MMKKNITVLAAVLSFLFMVLPEVRACEVVGGYNIENEYEGTVDGGQIIGNQVVGGTANMRAYKYVVATLRNDQGARMGDDIKYEVRTATGKSIKGSLGGRIEHNQLVEIRVRVTNVDLPIQSVTCSGW